jgi:hypothetical protein
MKDDVKDFQEDYTRMLELVGEFPTDAMVEWVHRTFGTDPEIVCALVEHLRFNEKCVAQSAEPCDIWFNVPEVTDEMVRTRQDEEASSALTLKSIRALIAALEVAS